MKLLPRSILFLAFASFAPLAFGQAISWTNITPNNSTFDTAANWTTATGISTSAPGPTSIVGLFPGFTTSAAVTYIAVTTGGTSPITINTVNNQSIEAVFVSADFLTNAVANGTLNLNFNSGSTLTVGATAGTNGIEVLGGATLNFTGNLNEVRGNVTVGQLTSAIDTTAGQVSGPGTLNIGAGTVTISSGTSFIVGNGTTGTVTQGTGSTVNVAGTLTIGGAAGTGTYNLQAGTINISSTSPIDVGGGVGATGILNQSGGALIAASGTNMYVGRVSTGTYNLTGGSINSQGIFYIDTPGIFNQSGASTLNVRQFFINGGATYNMNGGSAIFSLSLGITGTLNLNGGTIAVDETDLIGGGGGTLNFGGGTLALTPGLAPTGFYGMAGTLTANTSTIDASAAALTTYHITVPFSGAGGIALIGNGTTTFDFTNATPNSYTGLTSITAGTLNVSGADITSSNALNMGSAGILNLTLAAGGLSYGGNINGTGAFNVTYAAPTDTFEIKGLASNFTGPTTLTGGGIFEISNGTLGNITDAGGGTSLLIGDSAVTSPGTVNIGAGSFTGGVTVNSGFTLNAASLTSNVTNAGTLNTTIVTGNVTNSGTGTLTVGTITGSLANSGMATVTGALGIAGGVTSNSGILYALSAGSVATPVGVTSTGTLGLPLGSPIGSVFVITGPLSSTGSTAVLNIRYNGSAAIPVADSFVASGTATIDGASAIHITGVGNITTPIPIVTGTAGLSAATLPSINSTLLFMPTLSIVGNSIDLTTVQVPLATFALTPNETAAAGPIDRIIANPALLTSPSRQAAFTTLLSRLNTLTTSAQVASALEELTPEKLQYARNISFENSNFLAERMNGVCADLRGGYGGLDTSAFSVVSPAFNSGLGRSLGSLLASNDPPYHPAAPNGVNYYPGGGGGGEEEENAAPSPSTQNWDSSSQVISDSTPANPYMSTQNPSGPATPRLSEFIGGDVVLADLNQNLTGANAPSSKASYTAGDATAGVSFRMTSHLAAGVLFDYNHTDAKTDSIGSKTTVNSYSPGLFATYFDHGFYVNGLFSFGYNNYTNTRNISALGATASSHPTGQQYVGDLDFGYDFHPDKTWVIGPTIGATYTHLNIDSFTETGAPGADLAVNTQSQDSLRSRLGGHVLLQTNTGDVLLQPNITAMWQHEYMDSSSGITSSFADFSSSPFTIQTAAPSRDSALVGCGLTATLNNSMALYLNYLADIGAGDYFAQSVIGGFKARF